MLELIGNSVFDALGVRGCRGWFSRQSLVVQMTYFDQPHGVLP